MIYVVLFFVCIFIFAKSMNKAQSEELKMQPAKVACPPHSWSWQKVYNEDGSFHHQHLVCRKCGPLHGVSDE